MRAIALACAGLLAAGACTQDRIVFESSRALDGSDASGGASNIWVIKADGTGLTPLTKGTNAGSHNPRWSPDGTRIVFDSVRALDGTDAPNANFASNIWSVSPDVAGPSPLTKATDGGNRDPRWSPDGTRIVFQSLRTIDAWNIWLIKADGTGLTALTTLTKKTNLGYDRGIPRWSTDGSRIAFVSGRALDGTDSLGSAYNIWLINADGTGLTPLTTAKIAENGEPSWSPDGARITFQSIRPLDGTDAVGSTWNIWLIKADGTGLTPLTKATAVGADSWEPSWSPDGTRIAFESRRALDGTDALSKNARFNIWMSKADGTGLTPLTKTTGAQNWEPRWSANGTWLVFYSGQALDGSDTPNQNETSNIWTIRADGTGLTPVTRATALGADSSNPEVFHDVSPCGGGALNACGGCKALSPPPGSACQEANRCGRWRCVGKEALTCDTSQSAQDNGCGGCTPLPVPESGEGRGGQCTYHGIYEGILVCAKGGNSLVCCPLGTAGPGCGPN